MSLLGRLQFAAVMLSGAMTVPPAFAQGFTQDLRPTRPTQVIRPLEVPTIAPSTEASAEPLTALGDIEGMPEIDRPSRFIWNASRSGTMSVKAGGTFSLAYLSRGKPTYDRVALLFTEDDNNNQAGRLCADLTGTTGRITSVEGQIYSEPANDELAAVAKAQGMVVSGNAPLFLVRVIAPYNGDLIAAAALKKKAAVRAFPLGLASKCLRRSGGAYIADLSTWTDPGPFVVVGPTQPPRPPSVGVTTIPVGWTSGIDGINCSYIISSRVSDSTWEEVLKAKNIPRSVGTRFTMCKADFTTTYNNFSNATKAKIVFENALGAFSSAFNWTASKFQSVASALATPLKPIVGDKAATMFTEGLMGQLPGAPLTGNMNMVVDQGCEFVKAKVAGSLAEHADQKELNSDQKKTSDNAVQQACDAVKNALQENAKANDFLQIDLSREPCNPILYVRVTYVAMNGAPVGMMSEERSATVSVRSNGGPGPNTLGNGNFPQVLLLEREVKFPAGAAGTSVILPYLIDYAMNRKSMDYIVGATAYAGMRANAGGYPGNDLQIKDLLRPIEPPLK